MTAPFLRSRLIEQYAGIDPRDRQDTEIHLSTSTMDTLIGSVIWDGEAPIVREPGMLLGRPLRLDDSIPYGEFRFVTENAQDRAIRRATRDGITVNVMKLEALPPTVLPAPAPTLGALIKHWLRWPR